MYWILSYVDDNTIVKSFNNSQSVEEILQSMKKSLLEWNDLLNLTGGALSLPKCKVSVLKWKGNYWGIQKPVTKSNGEIITVPSEELGESSRVVIRRGQCNLALSVWHSDHFFKKISECHFHPCDNSKGHFEGQKRCFGPLPNTARANFPLYPFGIALQEKSMALIPSWILKFQISNLLYFYF